MVKKTATKPKTQKTPVEEVLVSSVIKKGKSKPKAKPKAETESKAEPTAYVQEDHRVPQDVTIFCYVCSEDMLLVEDGSPPKIITCNKTGAKFFACDDCYEEMQEPPEDDDEEGEPQESSLEM